PWGLELPADRSNVAPADWPPEVRERASSYWYTRSAALSTPHRGFCEPVGSSVIPVGDPPPPLSAQLPRSEPARVYLKTLSVAASSTTQIDVPSVTRSLASLLPLLRAKPLVAF